MEIGQKFVRILWIIAILLGISYDSIMFDAWSRLQRHLTKCQPYSLSGFEKNVVICGIFREENRTLNFPIYNKYTLSATK